MPLFRIKDQLLSPVELSNFPAEKQLQHLIERNLGVVFNCRLVATEYSTGSQHAGRIDTLALSEDGNPVIIEYKKVESSELINQSLYYLAWIHDHRGDFEMAVQKALGAGLAVDWTDVRVICIAPNYKKFDLHAVQVMGTNIELWTYRLFANGTLNLEEVLQRAAVPQQTGLVSGKNPVMVAAGKKAALTRKSATYSFEQHLDGKPEATRALALAVQEFILKLDPAIEEHPKKLYVAYRTSQNIVCMELHQKHLALFLKLDPKQHPGPSGISRDVSGIGHFGTGDLKITVRSAPDLERAKPSIMAAYQRVGS